MIDALELIKPLFIFPGDDYSSQKPIYSGI